MTSDTGPNDQGQCHSGLNIVKLANFKVYLLHRYACNQKTNGKL